MKFRLSKAALESRKCHRIPLPVLQHAPDRPRGTCRCYRAVSLLPGAHTGAIPRAAASGANGSRLQPPAPGSTTLPSTGSNPSAARGSRLLRAAKTAAAIPAPPATAAPGPADRATPGTQAVAGPDRTDRNAGPRPQGPEWRHPTKGRTGGPPSGAPQQEALRACPCSPALPLRRTWRCFRGERFPADGSLP